MLRQLVAVTAAQQPLCFLTHSTAQQHITTSLSYGAVPESQLSNGKPRLHHPLRILEGKHAQRTGVPCHRDLPDTSPRTRSAWFLPGVCARMPFPSVADVLRRNFVYEAPPTPWYVICDSASATKRPINPAHSIFSTAHCASPGPSHLCLHRVCMRLYARPRPSGKFPLISV